MKMRVKTWKTPLSCFKSEFRYREIVETMSDCNNWPTAKDSDHNPMTGIAYGTGLISGVLLVITIFTLVAYYCGRRVRTPMQHQEQISHDRYSSEGHNRLVVVGGGLDETTLFSYPTLTYAQAMLESPADGGESVISNCCSICLIDYADSDVLRRLPHCGHAFHLKCVDPWLKLHASCPICRMAPPSSPMPGPSSVEVVVVPS